MSNPIDATLAAFITQAIREAMAEERRADSRDRRRDDSRSRRQMNSGTRPYMGFGPFAAPTRPQYEPSEAQPQNQNCKFGTSCPGPFNPSGCRDTMCRYEPKQNVDTTQYKFVKNLGGDVKQGAGFGAQPSAGFGAQPTSKDESRYVFAKPATSTTTNSNVVVDSCCDIPNKNDPFNIIFQTFGRGVKPNDTASASGKTRPAQPNYPPPVYPGSDNDSLPELISDSEEDEPQSTRPNKNTSLADLQKAFDAQVPDAISGILSSLLGVDMNKELEGLADELLGTKTDDEKPAENKPPQDEKSAEPPKKEYVSRSMFSDAYLRFVPYLFNELAVSVNIKVLIDEYLTSLVMERMNEVNKPFSTRDPYYTKYTIHWKESSTRAVKAIATELSFSNRLAALEDMIKKMDSTELYKFKGFGGGICLS